MIRQARAYACLSIIAWLLFSPSARAQNVRYVDDDAALGGDGLTWDTAYPFLQDALFEVVADATIVEIRVAGGLYTPDQDQAGQVTLGDREATFRLLDGLELYGGFAGLADPDHPDDRDVQVHQTILGGDLNDDDGPGLANRADNSFHVVTATDTGASALLDGFTVRGGNADAQTFPNSAGGGLFNDNGSLTVNNCTFTRNSAYYGGAMYNRSNSNPTITNTRFRANSAHFGAALRNYLDSSPTLINCTFAGNHARLFGGALAGSAGCNAVLVACTLCANSAARGAGLYNYSEAEPSLTNCILWNNITTGGTAEAAQISGGSPQIDFSCVQGWTGSLGGTGNFDQDPLFVRYPDPGPDGTWNDVDDDFGDLHLACTSPCLDAGTNGTDPPLPDTDLDGNPRIIDTFADPGAFEGPNQAAVLARQSLMILEGTSAVFTVALACDPGDTIDLSVARELGDQDITVHTGDTLTFHSTNYWIPQPVTLAATEDDDRAEGTTRFRLDAPTMTHATVLAREIENDVGPVLFVDQSAPGHRDGDSWPDAVTELHNALPVAAAAPTAVQQIWVAAGTYTPALPDGQRTATFQLHSGLALYGGFAGTENHPDERDLSNPDNETILTGDLAGDDPDTNGLTDNVYHVLNGSFTDPTAVLDGFTITGGQADGDGTHRYGSGMFNQVGGPTIDNCIFRHNSAHYGAGMHNRYDSNPIINNCSFEDLSASRYGGGMYNYESSPSVTACTFAGNSALFRGGGMCNWSYSSPAITDCAFTDNSTQSGAGLYNYGHCAPVVTRCTFITNRCDYAGGGLCNWHECTPVVTDCLFNGNTATGAAGAGGGMFNYHSSPTVIACTFSGNFARNAGGGIYCDAQADVPESPTVVNCVLWGNHDGGGADESAQIHLASGSPAVSFSCIQGLSEFAGGNNIGDDPLLARDPDPGFDDEWGSTDDDLGDLHLACTSPCLDAGTNGTNPPLPGTDLDGNPRIANGTVDLGAYEGPIQALMVVGQPVIIAEGDTGTFTVTLACDPGDPTDVVVQHQIGDADIYIQSGELLNFNPGNYWIPQTVIVAAAEDDDLFPGQATFRLSAPDVPFVTVKAYEVENDILPILLVDADATGSNNGSTWTDAFNELHVALAVPSATPGSVSEIWVAEGTYTPIGANGDRNATFQLLSGLGVYGGFTGWETERDQRHPALFEHTILSGDLNGNDLPGFINNQENSYHVVTGSGTDHTAVLDGFAVTGGNTELPWRQDPQGGAGMYNDRGNPAVANCTFHGNRAKWGGGIYNHQSDPTVTTCTFTDNIAWLGAGMFNDDGGPTLTDCTFYKNSATYDGGALYNFDFSAPLLILCTFSANSGEWGGAVANQFDCEPTLTDCLFINNSAEMGGGLINFAGSPTLVGCEFHGNSATGSGSAPAYGGGMFDTEGGSTLIRCTFSGNHAKEGGGGVYAEEACGAWLIDCVFTDNTADWVGGAMYNNLGSLATLTNCTLTGNRADVLCGGIFNSFNSVPTVTNCILWNNSGPPSLRSRGDGRADGRDGLGEQDQIDGGSPTVTYTCIQGLDSFAGNGNIGDDPLFRPDGLHLRRRSPCRDAGDPTFVPFEGQTDIDGHPRVLDDRVDMGADEVPLDLGIPSPPEPIERPLR